MMIGYNENKKGKKKMNKENTEKTTKTIYQVWRSIAEQNDFLDFQSESLSEAGWRQGKLISLGIVSWLRIKERKEGEY